MMRLTPIAVACPKCASNDVFYSCKPDCCFNHVCNNCYTTFELETTRVGEAEGEFDFRADPDPTSPTAPCARCGECRVFALSDGEGATPHLVCADCKALLTLQVTNVQAG